MSAPSADFPALSASTSSSGFTDGLGRRALAFDREDGTMLERLVVRAELSAFERSLRDRVERIAALEDERLAKPRSIERGNDGSLVVLSEFVPGSRLSDLLDATAQQGTVPGVDVALGFLLDVLPALCGLHAGAGFAHGAISPGRTVLTPAGQIVLLDAIFGDALSRLQYSRRRLWAEFAVALPPAAGRPRLDAGADVAQVALAAVMLVLGRPVADYEYPDAIPSLLVEVVDVAQIRGSAEFAAGLQRFLQRSLPIPGRRPYTAADDALIDVRDLARSIGVDVCRRALVEFIEQQESSGQSVAAYESDESAGEYDYGFGVNEDEPVAAGTNGDGEADPDDDEASLEIDLDLDAPAAAEEDTIYDLGAGSDAVEAEAVHSEPEVETPVEDVLAAEPEHSVIEPAPTPAPEFEPIQTRSFSEPLREMEESVATDESGETLDAATSVEESSIEEPADTETVAEEAAEETAEEVAEDLAEEFGQESDETVESEPVEVEEPKGARRRKRSRSARSRKDKLRSNARPQLVPPPPAPPQPPPAQAARPTPVPVSKPTSSGWLVEPTRAASFEPPVPTYQTPAESAAFTPAPRPAPPVIPAPAPPPAPVVQLPTPVPVQQAVVPPPVPRPVAAPPPIAPPITLHRPPAPAPPPPSTPTLKLKAEPPAGYAPPRKSRPDPVEDLYSPRVESPSAKEPIEFPWKLAGAALVLMVVGVVAGRSYWPGGSSEPPARRAVVDEAPAPAAAPSPAAAPKTGRIQIDTQPPGARVLLNGKHVGESPLSLEAPAGRHTLTLAATSGSVRRTVRVEAGKTVVVDVPIFSGWVDVVAPIILDVSEDGKGIGNTEQNRLLLRPGRHELTFSNRDLDYTSSHTIDIEPGEVRTLTLDPRGTANLNASPWAEVWVNGKKVGETPLANLQLPLGTHEVVFKHPKFGERRVTTTIRANAPVAVSVDMSKQ